ncbi:fimbrial protein, partial [Escherichia coli]
GTTCEITDKKGKGLPESGKGEALEIPHSPEKEPVSCLTDWHYTTTPKSFQIRLQDCVFDTQETMTTTFTGTVSSANSGNYYTIFNTDTGAAFNNVSLAIGDSLGTSYKSGMGIDQKIVKDTSTNKGKAKQTLNFKAWLVGAADAPDLGNFEANTTFQITYL